MIYNDTTNNVGIIQACEDYCGLGLTGISGDTNKLKEFTRYSNKSLKKIWHWIFTSQGIWKYDDSNETDLPQATADLTSGTGKYLLPFVANSPDATLLVLERVEIKTNNDVWLRIPQIADFEIPGAIEEFMKDNAAICYYRLIGNTLEFKPIPDYSKTGGIKVYFKRGVVNFVYTDTSKEPGFASPYHEAIAVGASLEWLRSKRPDSSTINHLNQEWLRYETDIKKFYSLRNEDRIRYLGRASESYL